MLSSDPGRKVAIEVFPALRANVGLGEAFVVPLQACEWLEVCLHIVRGDLFVGGLKQGLQQF